tara:strand:- start:849 stop:1133 length:285 start_codon:yes stop_codon:yes gene_type:complete
MKTIERKILILNYIIERTEYTGQFSSSNRTISMMTKIPASAVGVIISKLTEEGLITKHNKSRYDSQRGFIGTTRVIQIDIDKAKEFITNLMITE